MTDAFAVCQEISTYLELESEFKKEIVCQAFFAVFTCEINYRCLHFGFHLRQSRNWWIRFIWRHIQLWKSQGHSPWNI